MGFGLRCRSLNEGCSCGFGLLCPTDSSGASSLACLAGCGVRFGAGASGSARAYTLGAVMVGSSRSFSLA